MAILIPALGSCVSRMTVGERRLAERLEAKLDPDYLLWYDVPVGPRQSHPDFVLLHPRRGLLILEVKDWKLETIRQASRQTWEIIPRGVPKTVVNPIEQARHYAHQVVDALCRDKQLIHGEGRWQGALAFPWSYGVVLTHITRRQFDAAELDQAIEPQRVICSDEMTESVDEEAFQARLWQMFPFALRGALSLPQIDRVRWTLFPEVRVPAQGGLFEDGVDGNGEDGKEGEPAEPPDILQVMDLQQEQLARSLGSGHRVIHGVAGSGKTMILGWRAEHLAKAATAAKPVLVLCYNEPLAVTLASIMQAKGIADRVCVRHFHQWCRQQLVAYGQALPSQGDGMFDQMVANVIRAVDRGQIPGGQYRAVLIDEGHDFAPEWLKLVTQMVDPTSNSLLLLYDDAQSIYKKNRGLGFTLKSVGIEASGRRSTILRINYRNTRQILHTASRLAGDLLAGAANGLVADDDAIPLLQPISCGREGPEPLVIRLPSLRDQATKIADLMCAAHEEGHAFSEMAVLCKSWKTMDECAAALRRRRLPHQVRRRAGDFDPAADSIKVMTMYASKGLEFPVVAVMEADQVAAGAADQADAARLLYVAATRATQRLVLTLSSDAALVQRHAVAAGAVGTVGVAA
ncbi:MAG: 3'-5' exonuclease [Burkholderiales bacterium]